MYDELTVDGAGVEAPPIDVTIDEGWARVARPLEYANPLVSRAVDGVRRYIASADDRRADEIERADPALAGVAARALTEGTAEHAYVYTTDILAGDGAEAILDGEGYGDAVTYVDGFRFVEDLLE